MSLSIHHLRRARVASLGLVATIAACDCRGDRAASDPDGIPIGGWYRAEVRAEGGEVVPFFVALPADHQSASARIVNGAQEVVAEHAWSGVHMDLEFPVLRTHIEAGAGEGGALEGSIHHESLALGDSKLSFTAEPVNEPDPEARFLFEGDAPTEIATNWRLTFDDTGDAQLSLTRSGDSAVEGLLRLDNGNAIYLAGNRRGDTLRLSGFDGSSAYLLDAAVAGDRLEGTWLAGPGLGWREPITGAAEPRFEIDVEVSLPPGTHRLPVPELREEPFAGSPVILALTGSFNPASMRAIPFLTELYREHRDAGLEILALNYELSADEAYNDAIAETIAEVYEVPWQLIPVDGTAEEYLSIVPAGLEGIDVQSFPVLVFIDRDGLVHEVRAGFPPEAASEAHEATVADYRELAAAIAGGTGSPP